MKEEKALKEILKKTVEIMNEIKTDTAKNIISCFLPHDITPKIVVEIIKTLNLPEFFITTVNLKESEITNYGEGYFRLWRKKPECRGGHFNSNSDLIADAYRSKTRLYDEAIKEIKKIYGWVRIEDFKPALDSFTEGISRIYHFWK
jgi:hypothetical protein